MKTFKLISFGIIEDEKLKPIELVDGLIIDKEDDNNAWTVEVYTRPDNIEFFEKALAARNEFRAQVVISKKENVPVIFQVKVLSVKMFEANSSILLQGVLLHSSRRTGEKKTGKTVNG